MRVLSIGEPLIEFTARADAPSTFDRRAGGDTLNTAVYLARLTAPGTVGYLSCLGDDPHSRWLRSQIEAEGVDTAFLAERAGGRPGLSFIATDPTGERSFAYWRDQSPFRDMFRDPADHAALDKADTLFLSAVALAVLHPEGREALLGSLQERRAQGASVVFDTNYRPALWPDAATARQVIGRAAGTASLLLPSFDDMAECFGCADPASAIAALRRMGQAEIILTTGGAAVLRCAAGGDVVHRHELPPAITALDTTGAGDSFNAGLLAARLAGLPPGRAIAVAARLAAVVVTHPGAIIPKAAMPDLDLTETHP
ncbi:sugar kinase [Paracoccus sp. SSK6]|uniref:sugar kinase n=1 Tax=Paracoccus sp. SSK6 TaxID=3143131 RepID=UPI003219D297